MKDVWLKATVVGSLWAAIEIIMGSFLHNLRLPLAGSMLSFSAVILMVSFLRIWPQRGMIIRAAIICAMMKSISPSAVIIGPMTGIMLEGLLMEMGLMLFGVNKLALIIGGMLAVFSSILHKAITLIIIYGWDLVKLLEGLYSYAVKQIGLDQLSPLELLLVLSSLYFIAGLVAALIAFRLQAKPISSESSEPMKFDSSGKALFEYTDMGKYSVSLLITILLGITALLLAMNMGPWWIFVPGSLIFVSWLFIRYKRAVRPLTRPKFWIQFALITILASVVIQAIETGEWFTMRGLSVGLMINLRAVVILTGFAAIGTELKNPLVKTVLYQKGFASLYTSLNMAFATLPGILVHLPSLRKSWKRIPSLIREFLNLSSDLYEYYASMMVHMPTVYLMIGDSETGKTTYLSNLANELRKRKVRVGGFLAVGVHVGDQRTGYGLLSVEHNTKAGFCQTDFHEGWSHVGRFYVDPAGEKFGHELIRKAIKNQLAVVIIDEVGPLEMQNKGWADDLQELSQHADIVQVWAVRNKLVEKVSRKWPFNRYEILRPGTMNPDALVDKILT
ncbi:MAG: hypothetical protein J7L96_00885 [Bacteroidales bacterium]|nr:hypothetical protein [Bacteroidales bacterium]